MSRLALPFRGPAWVCAAVLCLTACGGGGGSHSSPTVPAPSPTGTTVGIPPTRPTVAPSPTASPGTSPTPVANAAAYACPTSDTPSVAVVARTASGESVRRVASGRTRQGATAASASQLVAVTYDLRTATMQKTVLGTRESALGATLVRSYTFSHAGLATHVLRVPAASVARVEAALRAQPGVRSVGLTGARRSATSVNAPYFTNDPYFTGFSQPGPLEENAAVPGQWDMHATRLEYAFAYSQPGNGSGVSNSAALGSSAVKIAVIDTGEDTTHPELASKIVYQRCFITDPGTNVQSSSTFTTDGDGHGTDVAGIAAAATNNGLGFAGAGGNVELYAYRVFPTPDDNCTNDNTSDSQCTTDNQDIASAITDAVDNHVNVISLSLGGGACVNGQDPDPQLEGPAISEAIASNIVVVAAAGNSSGPPVDAPACDPGVIAVGATSLADGTTNGSNKAGGAASAPFEYVASYTDYGSPGAAVGSSSAWGIVAPGGDPSGATDSDYLHWIENIWTSTPFDSNFAGSCSGDYPGNSSTVDCRVLIAGTSMATPHVAGAAALIISVNPTYQSPALMKQLLCATADDIADPNEGCGRLDVYRAMATALGDPNIPAPRPIP